MEIDFLSPLEQEALKLSVRIACWSVIASLPPGVFFAWLLARKNFTGKKLLDGIIHLPLVLPPVVIGYLLLVGFGRNGFIGRFLYEHWNISLAFTWKGAVLAAAVMSFPLLVRAIRLSLEHVDKGLEDAALTLGAHPLRIFFTITLPLALPGVITGCMLAFARSLGEFGATIMFVSNIPGQTQTLPLALYTLTQTPDGDDAAMRMCFLAIVLAMGALLFSDILSKAYHARLEK